MNSKCYRKYHEPRTWFSASNDCLSRNGSLAVFTDIGRPSDNRQLTEWLNASNTYWIGLVRSRWKTAGEGRVGRRWRRPFSTDSEIYRRRFDGVVIYFAFKFRLQIFRRRVGISVTLQSSC